MHDPHTADRTARLFHEKIKVKEVQPPIHRRPLPFLSPATATGRPRPEFIFDFNARGPRLRPRVPPLSQGQLNAFLAQKHLSEPLMIIEPEISL